MKKVVVVLLVSVAQCVFALPNLIVIEANQPEGLECIDPSQQYVASVVVKNNGDALAAASVTRINMWGQPYFIDTPALEPGATFEATAQSIVFNSDICQNYTVKGTADNAGTITESDETDNILFAPYMLTLCSCLPSPTPTMTMTAGDTATQTPTEVPSSTPSPTRTTTETVTQTETEVEVEATHTATNTNTATLWPTPSPTMTATGTRTSTGAPTATVTRTPSATKTVTQTRTGTEEPTATKTETSVHTATRTSVPTHTPTTIPPTVTQTATATATGTQTGRPNLIVIEANQPEGLECIDPSQQYVASVVVKNNGDALAAASVTRINMWGQPYFIDTPALEPGATFEATAENDTFIPVTCRDYTLKGTADYTEVIVESDENDNILFASYTLTLCSCLPSPTPTVTATATHTLSPTQTKTATATQTGTSDPTATETTVPTSTPTNTTVPPTSTRTSTPTATRTATATPTETQSFCDRGFYLLDSFGSLHKAGNPPVMSGGYMSQGLAMDAEKVRGDEDLAIIDGSGVATFVNDPVETPVQDFFFQVDSQFPMGRAVDLTVTPSGDGFWVLTDFGGIYRAGTAKVPGQGALVPGTDQLPIGYDIPFGQMRRMGLPNPGGTSLRAVAFAVINPNGDDAAEGYIILDSQGGRFLLDANGTTVPPGTYANRPSDDPLKLLDGAYVWPFFPGLDIARDIELHPSQQGLVVLDGWGGIHPVPVDRVTNPVYFTHNDDPLNPGTLITTVGMPYVVNGFDDPSTPQDEGDDNLYGIDAESIFVEFDFSPHCPNGFYTLDKWGGVFTFGGARKSPDSTGAAWPSSYFFPNMYGKKLIVY